MSQLETGDKRHPIQVVARRTGLTLDLLRAWEKRYGVVEPARSEGGRRLYSDDDVERLRLLRRASEAGRRISRISQLSVDELAAMVEEDSREEVAEQTAARTDLSAGIFLKASLSAVERLDPRELEATLKRALVTLSGPVLIDGVLAPLLEQIGEQWCHGLLSPANEHLASAIVVRILGDVISAAEPTGTAPNLVVATPAGQVHEFGALFVAATAAADGWRVTYLGRDLPGGDIAATANATGAEAVALSIVSRAPDAGELEGALLELRKKLSGDVPILVGGASADSYVKVLDKIGAERIDSLDELRSALAEVA
jgi:DNA-binding transcriptional MerR regulator/methylmalonyl-CoA mutase cobalamin-binding subunit